MTLLQIILPLCQLVFVFILTINNPAFAINKENEGVKVPPASFNIPPMIEESSVSTFIPSKVAPKKGIAVNIIYPKKPRYKEGAPIAVVIPGEKKATGLEFSMHASQAGFAELRFAFPGGGSGTLSSDGFYDYRGPNCQIALKDILLFAAGKKVDVKGRTINNVVPVKLLLENVGIVGIDNGGNIALVVLGKGGNGLKFVRWLAFYESPVGAWFFPPNLGGAEDFLLNKHYREGSCATGHCLIDFRKLAWDPKMQKEPGEHKRVGEPEIKGVLFFDENKSKTWDEVTEFALTYTALPNVEKQIYPPSILRALERLKTFEQLVSAKTEEEKEKDREREKEEKEQAKPVFLFFGKKKLPPKKQEPEFVLKVVWPQGLATVQESEHYYQEVDGSYYIQDACRKIPTMLVDVVGTAVDHLQGQPDHPHIAFLYNAFLANNVWVRLNPDPSYVGQIAYMNFGNFVNNKPNSSINADSIVSQLEAESIVPDYIFMDAAIAELADRCKTKNLKDTLDEPIINYSNGAIPQIQTQKDSGESVSDKKDNHAKSTKK